MTNAEGLPKHQAAENTLKVVEGEIKKGVPDLYIFTGVGEGGKLDVIFEPFGGEDGKGEMIIVKRDDAI